VHTWQIPFQLSLFAEFTFPTCASCCKASCGHFCAQFCVWCHGSSVFSGLDVLYLVPSPSFGTLRRMEVTTTLATRCGMRALTRSLGSTTANDDALTSSASLARAPDIMPQMRRLNPSGFRSYETRADIGFVGNAQASIASWNCL
jgi:hypothetical protein